MVNPCFPGAHGWFTGQAQDCFSLELILVILHWGQTSPLLR